MDLKLTDALQEALSHAMMQAQQAKQAEVTDSDVLNAILKQESGVVHELLDSFNLPVAQIVKALEEEIMRQNKVSDSSKPPQASQKLQQALYNARALATKMGDAYTGQDHLFIAICQNPPTSLQTFLRQAKLTDQDFSKKIKSVRKGATMDSPNAESTMNALDKYTKNLTKLASLGKLDPVIGRDEEIRRTMQVLSRRTKTTPFLSENLEWEKRRSQKVLL